MASASPDPAHGQSSRSAALRLADALDAVNRRIGLAVRWLALAMVLVQFVIVLMRYVFGVSFVWADEGVMYLHASLFMLGAGYTLLVDGHVRVDVVSARLSDRARRAIDLAGHLLLLIPSMTVLLLWSWPSVARAWSVLEGPVSVGGIPASFLLKSLIPAFCVLLIVQALAHCARQVVR
ncbi:MAG: TRAP transporter small permease subunit [Pseudomonadota bacterium]